MKATILLVLLLGSLSLCSGSLRHFQDLADQFSSLSSVFKNSDLNVDKIGRALSRNLDIEPVSEATSVESGIVTTTSTSTTTATTTELNEVSMGVDRFIF